MANTASSLVLRLNALLTQLRIPIAMEFPTDLTPSLLLAILESILGARIPIEKDYRRRLTTQPRDFDAKVHCMKIFLGVLESDVLKVDVNLDKIDPRKLARGDWDEVVYVGDLLCQIGELLGLLPPRKAGAASTSTSPNTSGRRSRRATASGSSVPSTSMDNRSAASDPGPQRSYSRSAPPPSSGAARRTGIRRCIHALDTPDLLSTRPRLFEPILPAEFTTCHCPAADIPHLAPLTQPTSPGAAAASTSPVRRSGYIHAVDEDEELHSFESARSTAVGDDDASRFSFEHVSSYLSGLDIDADAEPWSHTRTLQLKRERARLLSELAKFSAPS
ncbi:hypothetical protein HDZ31DRAFT_63549 [Schizophyllum fasciatum]